MQRKTFTSMNCSIAQALEEVGEWWSLLIVRECTEGVTRFDEFHQELGIARNTLTTRLERLTNLGILEKYPLEDRANTDGYRLTEKGEALYPVLVALMQWGDRWSVSSRKLRTKLVEDATGRPIEDITVRSKGGRPLSFRDVRVVPGPEGTATTHAAIARRNGRVLGRV